MNLRPAIARAAFLAGVPAAAVLVASRGARAAGPLTLRVAVAPADATGQIFYAVDRGMFAPAGLDVDLNVLQNSAAMATAVSSGAVDVGASSVAVVANADERGLRLRFLGTGDIYSNAAPPTAELVVAKDSPIHSGADLNGKIVAVNGLKDITQMIAQAWLEKNGADLRTIKFIEIPFGSMPVALEQGRIAAAILVYPFLARAKGQVRVLGNPQAAFADRWLVIGWIASDTWLGRNAELAKRFVAVMARSAAWANTHPKESAQILGRYMKVPPTRIDSMPRAQYDANPVLNPDLVQPVIDASVKYGSLAHRIPASELIWSGAS